jgi:hypothetical protein
LKTPLDFPSLFPEVELIRDAALRSGVEAVWQELWQASELESIQDLVASPEFPYPHIPHNRAVVQMALAVASTFERFHSVTVDRDLLVAAALLQDASKLVEFNREGDTVTYSELGRQYPHAFWAAHIALKHGLPDAVCHIIIHHTPQAAKFPTSLEGKILYYVDQIDVLAIHRDRWRKELVITK